MCGSVTGFAVLLSKTWDTMTALAVCLGSQCHLLEQASPAGLALASTETVPMPQHWITYSFAMEKSVTVRLSDSTLINIWKSFWAVQKNEFHQKKCTWRLSSICIVLRSKYPWKHFPKTWKQSEQSEQEKEKCIYQRLHLGDLDISVKTLSRHLVFLSRRTVRKVHYQTHQLCQLFSI